jgi:hypothetical protein
MLTDLLMRRVQMHKSTYDSAVVSCWNNTACIYVVAISSEPVMTPLRGTLTATVCKGLKHPQLHFFMFLLTYIHTMYDISGSTPRIRVIVSLFSANDVQSALCTTCVRSASDNVSEPSATALGHKNKSMRPILSMYSQLEWRRFVWMTLGAVQHGPCGCIWW